ncbi:MAG: iron uptake porin, partial [Cyanobacteria bacterium J06633_2]
MIGATLASKLRFQPARAGTLSLLVGVLAADSGAARDLDAIALLDDPHPLNQITSVSQLTDVQPTDWAFQSLQAVVEHYGCIAGYPDGTYRGDRPLSRYEFAAGLNACLDRVNEMIAAGLADTPSQEELAVLQRLQEEFAAELALLRGQIDTLEARAATVEANQFSSATKLRGEISFSVNSLFGDERADGSGEALDDNVTFNSRVRLNFDTSFTGTDLFRVRLDALDPARFDIASAG